MDIVEVNQADGLDPLACRKLNSNFRNIAAASGQTQVTQSFVDSISDAVVPVVRRDLMDEMYPVGSVIITMDSNDRRLSYGQWRPVAQGRFLLSADTDHPAKSEGGAREVKLKASDLPPHHHTVSIPADTTEEGKGYAVQGSKVGTKTVSTSDYPTGTQTSVSTVPPYFSAYMYERYR